MKKTLNRFIGLLLLGSSLFFFIVAIFLYEKMPTNLLILVCFTSITELIVGIWNYESGGIKNERKT